MPVNIAWISVIFELFCWHGNHEDHMFDVLLLRVCGVVVFEDF